jgi:hypothetical protein
VTAGGSPVAFSTFRPESSAYVDSSVSLPGPREVQVRY